MCLLLRAVGGFVSVSAIVAIGIWTIDGKQKMYGAKGLLGSQRLRRYLMLFAVSGVVVGGCLLYYLADSERAEYSSGLISVGCL